MTSEEQEYASVVLATEQANRNLEIARQRLWAAQAELYHAQQFAAEAERVAAHISALRTRLFDEHNAALRARMLAERTASPRLGMRPTQTAALDTLLSGDPASARPVSPPPWVPREGEPGPRPETSVRSVQTVLLALGGILLAIAAVVFTVVAWGAFGIGGRAVILAGITAVLFAAPAVLVRKGLASTAETLAMLALVLFTLDGYAVWHVGWVPDTLEPTGYAGLVFALAAGVALGYPALVPVGAMRPTGLVLAHLSAVLVTASTADAAAHWAFLGLALVAGDLVVRWRVTGSVLRRVAGVCGGLAAVLGLLAGLLAAGSRSSVPERAVGTLVLLGLALAVVAAAETVRTSPPVARALAAAVALPVALVGPLLQWALFGPDGWALTAFAVAVAVGAVVTLGARTPWRKGVGIASAALAGGAALVPAAAVGFTLLSPVADPDLVWGASSATQPVWAMSGTRATWDAVAALVVVLATGAVLAVALGLPGRSGRVTWRAALGVAGVVAAAGMAVLVPSAGASSIAVAALASGAVATGATIAGALLRSAVGPLLLGLGGILGAHAVVLALASRDATLVALGAVTVLSGVLAVFARAPRRQGYLTGVTLGALASFGAAVATAVTADASGWAGGPGPAGLAVGLTGVVALVVAGWIRKSRPLSALVAAILAGVTAYLGLALAGWTLVLSGIVRTVDRPMLALLALAAAVVAALAARIVTPPAAARWSAVGAAAPGLAVAVQALVPGVAAVLLAPLGWVTAVWRGAPTDAAQLGPSTEFAGTVLDPVALLVLGAVGMVLLRVRWPREPRTVLRFGLPAVAPAIAELAPALHAPWPVALVVLLALAAAGATIACVPGGPADEAGAPGRRGAILAGGLLTAFAGLTAVAWSLADQVATLAVLGTVLAGAATITVLVRTPGPRRVAAGTGVAASVALAFATGAAADVPTAYLLLGVATALVLPGMFAAPRVVTDVLDAGA
ncbi:hypothetical protein, partial [Cryptosporangium minutisporangium]